VNGFAHDVTEANDDDDGVAVALERLLLDA
jgi:hypothetical protein